MIDPKITSDLQADYLKQKAINEAKKAARLNSAPIVPAATPPVSVVTIPDKKPLPAPVPVVAAAPLGRLVSDPLGTAFVPFAAPVPEPLAVAAAVVVPDPEPDLSDFDLDELLEGSNVTVPVPASKLRSTVSVVPPYRGFRTIEMNKVKPRINAVSVPAVALAPAGSGWSGWGSAAAVAVAPAFKIEVYSDRAIVLRGDGRKIKEKLTDLGGVFNSRLRGGPGWIFANRKEADLRAYLGL